MTDIFLSYNRGDRTVAQHIAKGLEDAGYVVWWDTALRAGQTYDEVTEGKLRAARAVVVLWSHRSVKSKWVRAEATMAENRARLVPVMIEECERPLRFELIQTADLIGWDGDRGDERWQDFLEDLQSFVAETAPPPVAEDTTIAATVMEEEVEDEEEDATEDVLPIVAAPEPAPEPPPAPPPPPAPQPEPPPPIVEAVVAPPPSPPPPPVEKPAPPAVARAAALFPVPPAAPSRPIAGAPGPSPVLIGAIAIGAVLLLGGIFMQMQKPDAAPQTEIASIAPASVTPLEASPSTQPTSAAPKTTETADGKFRDCDDCPDMRVLPAGAFLLGSPEGEPQRQPYEGPQQEVPIAPFAIGATEVTVAQWKACLAGGGCGGYDPTARSGGDNQPVTAISWRDAVAYTQWLSTKTGRAYRLPAESEWEYAARAGTRTAYWWGPAPDPRRTPTSRTADVTSDEPNAFGLHHVAGNVREWVQDCYVSGYSEANRSGAAIETGNCNMRVVRGGGWRDRPAAFRVANRGRNTQTTRDGAVGFRVAAAVEK